MQLQVPHFCHTGAAAGECVPLGLNRLGFLRFLRLGFAGFRFDSLLRLGFLGFRVLFRA